MVSLSVPSYVTWSNVRRFGKMIPYYLCDGAVVHQDALERIVRGTKDASTGKYSGGVGYKNLGASIRKSFVETEKSYNAVLARDGSFCKYAGKTLRGLPGEVSTAWTTASQAAKAAGKSGIWAGIKGSASALFKRLPLIGSIIYAATEVPNIARATADGGLVSGAAETVKAVGRMAGFTAGAAIGQVLIPIPFVGGIIGGLVGENVVSMVTGKSYTEQKEKIEEETLEKAQKTGMQGVSQPEDDEYIVENDIGLTLTNKQLKQLDELQNEIMEKNNSTFNVSA